MAHGGPHSAYPAEFVPFTAAFVKAGFAVVATNFRGSVGYGQEFVRSLPKHCGDLDVNDVLFVAKQLVEEGKIDKEKLVLCGGSHGGFITLHAWVLLLSYSFKQRPSPLHSALGSTLACSRRQLQETP
mmetsp:Transcript_29209/g.75210  ORF Transcript_29209/g.75210 Transcript_29209/m.75210 type:complete len:128 (+) Transcript_29209:1554-1937(+)